MDRTRIETVPRYCLNGKDLQQCESFFIGGNSAGWAAVWTDTAAGQPLPADHPLAGKRTQVDLKVLANLLRLNHARAKN